MVAVIFKCIFLNEKFCIMIRISLKFVPKNPVDNKWALVQVMVWRPCCTKPLSETMMVILLTHRRQTIIWTNNGYLLTQVCVTRPQWVDSHLLFCVQLCGALQWAPYHIRIIAGSVCAGNARNVFSTRRLQRKPLFSDPGMHQGTCVTHGPWCMSGSLTCGGGENVLLAKTVKDNS